MTNLKDIHHFSNQQPGFTEAPIITSIDSEFLNQLQDRKNSINISNEIATIDLAETQDITELESSEKQKEELNFYRKKYEHLFKNDRAKENFMRLDDIKIIKQEVMMEILTNPESLNKYLEKIKNDYNKISEANKNRRKDYIKDQMFQLKLLTNLLTKDSKMKESANAYLSWLTAELNNLEE